jgi:hypothetical protein
MTDDEFKGLFSNDEAAEMAAAAKAAEEEYAAQLKAAKQAGKDGMHYESTEQDSNGHSIVRYAVRMGGKVVLWVLLDMDVHVAPPAMIPADKVPAGLVFVRVQIQSGDRSQTLDTTGSIAAYPSTDGGYRAARDMLRAYVAPRIPRFVGQLYGV